MSIDYIGPGGLGQIGNLKKNPKLQGDQKTEKGGADKVEFSSVLQHVNQAKAASGDADVERAERIAELKAQIQEGSYQPDLEKVSSSLLQFLVEGK